MNESKENKAKLKSKLFKSRMERSGSDGFSVLGKKKEKVEKNTSSVEEVPREAPEPKETTEPKVSKVEVAPQPQKEPPSTPKIVQEEIKPNIKTQNKAIAGKSDARRQAESMEAFQRNFFMNSGKNSIQKNEEHISTYDITPNSRDRAQSSAAQMIEQYRKINSNPYANFS